MGLGEILVIVVIGLLVWILSIDTSIPHDDFPFDPDRYGDDE